MYNKLIVMGNLVREPSSKEIGKDLTVCNFTVATNRKRGENEEVAYVDCAAFGKQGETISKYFKKGDRILVEGRLRSDSWETEDGQKRSKLNTIVEQFSFANGGKKDEGQAAQQTLTNAADATNPF